MFDEIKEIFERTDDSNLRVLPPRDLYHETWLLRLTLLWFSKQTNYIINSDSDRLILKALKFMNEARFYTNAKIETAFKKRNEDPKDPLAEANSNVSGVIGHFIVKYGKKREKIALKSDASQFIVIDSIISNELTKGIKCARYYNQVAKTIGCMVYNMSKCDLKNFEKVGYYLILPQSELALNKYQNYTYKKDIEEKILKRVEQYGECSWVDQFNLIFQRILVECLTWEDVIKFISKNDSEYGVKLNLFYKKCLKHHL